ncbi:hypothetical protein SPF06_17130 [Sinomonas sp. JGH33]|uniref:Transposase n=1 Tax=Sinomonas terricola TaxID=3110330 RepID=A0ABU5T9W9_9MICC|nr:hypothetical protein [Sinomonas sp. JGH33]MEA5456457.1 hypothetical protein [Sinomonas sp. JGH33]
MDLAAVAAELYGLPLAEFTPARNDQAKAARSEGNLLLAKQVAKLPKPSMAAWAVNMLARHRGEVLERVLGLGGSLRKAQDERDPDALRRLGQERQKMLAEAVAEARAVAGEFGAPISNAAATDIEQTLRAAMADPEAGLALASRQLVRALSTNGFDPVDLSGAIAVPGAVAVLGAVVPGAVVPGAVVPGAGASREVAPEDAEESPRHDEAERARSLERERERARERAQAEADDAERAADRAEADLAEAERIASDARSRRGELAARLRDLRAQAADLEEKLADVERESADAERSRKLAARLADRRRKSAERARDRADDLSG